MGGVRIGDYADGPQFYAEFQRQQAGRWGEPLAPPVVEQGAWVLRFPAGAEMRWMPGASSAAVTPPCRFQLGFAALRALIPDQVGVCTEHEHFNVANGDMEQRTTGGLLVWRKADNWTAFTDGDRTWLNGPEGLQVRLNAERLAWELPASP